MHSNRGKAIENLMLRHKYIYWCHAKRLPAYYRNTLISAQKSHTPDRRWKRVFCTISKHTHPLLSRGSRLCAIYKKSQCRKNGRSPHPKAPHTHKVYTHRSSHGKICTGASALLKPNTPTDHHLRGLVYQWGFCRDHPLSSRRKGPQTLQTRMRQRSGSSEHTHGDTDSHY